MGNRATEKGHRVMLYMFPEGRAALKEVAVLRFDGNVSRTVAALAAEELARQGRGERESLA